MKLVIERDAALSAVTRAASVSPSRGTIPILNHVLIQADKSGRVTLRATDLDIEVTVHTTAKVIKPGATTVSADKLLQIVKNAALGSDIEMDLGERLAIKSGRSRFNLAVIPPSDFPTFSAVAADVTFTLPAPELHAILSSVKSAAGIDEGRYVLKSTHLFSVGGKFGAVTTDGKRLALNEDETDIEPFGVIVPSATVAEALSVLDGGEVTVSVSATKLHIACGEVEITSKVIDGT